MDIVLPPLYAPFRSTVNPHAKEADERVIDWVNAFHLAPSEDWAAYYRKAKFTWFAARCFPEADLVSLTLAAQFNVWLFLLDDSCDEVETGRKYDYLRQMATELFLVMAGRSPHSDARQVPLVSALADLWERLKALGNQDWQGRFWASMVRYLDACKLEATFLDQGLWPGIDVYMKTRPYLGAVHLEPDLSEVLCGIPLTRRTREHPRIAALTLLCCNIVCWSNDLFSLEKELKNGDSHNLVLVLQHELNYTLSEAITETAAIHDRDVQRFVELRGELDKAGLDPYHKTLPEDRALGQYISTLQNIISANMEWSIVDSKRYRFSFEVPDDQGKGYKVTDHHMMGKHAPSF